MRTIDRLSFPCVLVSLRETTELEDTRARFRTYAEFRYRIELNRPSRSDRRKTSFAKRITVTLAKEAWVAVCVLLLQPNPELFAAKHLHRFPQLQ